MYVFYHDATLFYLGGVKEFSSYEVGNGLIFVQIIGMYAKVSCAIFAMMTGFFLINAKKEGYYKKLVPMVEQIYFYSFLIFVIFWVYKIIPISLRDILRSIFPFAYGGWYAVHYILLYLLIPFINPYIKSLERKNFTHLLILIFVMYSIIPTFFAPTVVTTETYDFGSMDFMLVFYLIGAYIRIHVIDKIKYNNKWNLMVALSCAFFMFLSVIVFDYLGKVTGIGWFINNARWFAKNFSVFVIVMSVAVFLYFLNFTFYNNVINEIGSTVFGVYLIHNNCILRKYVWTVIFPNAEYIYNPYLHATVKIVIFFFVCMSIELLRKKTIAKFLDEKLMSILENGYKKLKNIV